MEQACGKRLLRLTSCINQTKNYRQFCRVGKIEDCELGLFQDASFAGDWRGSKSTSEGLLCMLGSHTFVPTSWMCKKQTAVSHSSVESEIISLDAGLRMDGLPALPCGECVLETLSSKLAKGNLERPKREKVIQSLSHSDNCTFESIDHAPPTILNSSHSNQLLAFEKMRQ